MVRSLLSIFALVIAILILGSVMVRVTMPTQALSQPSSTYVANR